MDFEIIEVPDSQTVVITEEQPAEVISEGMQGPPGPKGDRGEQGIPGPNTIGGFTVELTNAVSGDLLGIGNNKVINISASNITDGGNF